MGDHERVTTVQVPSARLFSYLAHVANLMRLTSATPGPDDYYGELAVEQAESR